MRGLLKVLLCGGLLAMLVAVAGWWQLQRYMDTPLRIAEPGMDITLQRGGSLGSLAYALSSEGVLQSPRWLTAYSRLTGSGRDIHAGDYWLDAGITPRQLLAKLEAGDVRLYEVTLVEGWTLQQVLAHLRAQSLVTQTLTDKPLSAAALGIDWQLPLEGMFFPDTYRYHRGETDVSILQRAFARMQQVLHEEWQQRAANLPYETPYEALIMASIVEKETGFPPERPIIAGVFVRRLQKGMRLQTDPTIIYGLGEGFDGNLRSRHLKDAANRYNTYRHHGLTPTPIALAGREAIHAALHPAEGDALYFVARGDGSHYFSATLQEHQQAVRKYQIEQRRKNYSSSPPPALPSPQSKPQAEQTNDRG